MKQRYYGKHMSAEGMHRGHHMINAIKLIGWAVFYLMVVDLFYAFLVGFAGQAWANIIYWILGIWMILTRGGRAFVARRFYKLKYYYTLAFL